MRERKMLVLLLMLALSIIPMIIINPVHAMAHVAVDPPSVMDVPPGSSFFVNITVTGVTDLYAWEVVINWDPNLLELTLATEGPFLKWNPWISTYFATNIDNPLGKARVGCTIKGAVPGATGSGTLAYLKFKVEEISNSTLHLSSTTLKDSTLKAVPHTWSDGYFDNKALSALMSANLVRRSAWPEHHHRNNFTDEDAYNTLYGKVRNTGNETMYPVYVKVSFVVTGDGLSGETFWSSVSPRLGYKEIADVSFDMGPFDSLMVNQRYSVEAKAWYSYGGFFWYGPGAKVKTFTFYVKG